MRNKKITGIILHSKPFFENDKLIELFSPTEGRIKLLAKYAQKRHQIFGGRLEPLNHVELVLYKGSSFQLITQCDLLTTFPTIRNRFNTLSMAFYICNIVRKATLFDQHNHALFSLLFETLQQLNQQTETSLSILQETFEKKFLETEGLLDESSHKIPLTFRSQFEAYVGEKLCQPLQLTTPPPIAKVTL